MRPPRTRKLRRRGDVVGLIDALGYVNLISIGNGERVDSGVTIRLRALEALAELASPDDVPAISVALGDPDPTVRQLGARVIRRLGPIQVANELAAAVVTPQEPEFIEARLEALDALEDLSKSGEKGTAKRVAIAAVDGGPTVALDQLSRDALAGLLDQASHDEISTLVSELIDRLPTTNGSLEHVQAILSWLAPHSVKPLIEALRREGGFREPAVAVLGAIRDSQALEPLVGVLEDRRADVRRVTAWALGELRDPRTAEALMRATMDAEYAVRCQAGEALDAMGSIALMAGVANMIRSLEGRSDGPAVARLVEEGLERTPPSARSRTGGSPRWAPRFVERFQLRHYS